MKLYNDFEDGIRMSMDKIEKINDLFDKYFKYKKDDKKNKVQNLI